MLRLFFLLAMGFGVAGCTAIPAAAPTSMEIETAAQSADGFQYAVVHLDARVASILSSVGGPRLSRTFAASRYRPSLALRVGDVVSVTVYESGGSTLFGGTVIAPGAAPTPGAAAPPAGTPTTTPAVPTTIPPQVIEQSGEISVPFAGRVRLVGLSPQEAARRIEEKLSGSAVNPQVIVSQVGNLTNAVTVGGEINRAGTVPLSLRRERILDVVALAGGTKYPAYETYIRLIRGGRSANVLLQHVVSDGSENLVVQPGDQLYLTRYPRTFAVFGAANRVSQYTFDAEKVTLAEAVSRGGGPIDTVGTPSGVYLFRFEPEGVAHEILAASASATPIKLGKGDEFVPIAYHVDLSRPEGYFLAQTLQIRDKDVVLLTNAEGAQLLKVLTIVRGFTGVAYDLAGRSK